VSWKALVVVLALLDPITRMDLEVRDAIQAARTPALERPMRSLTEVGKPVVALSGLLALAVFGGSPGVATVRGCLAVLVPVNLAVEGLKWGVGRVRPDGDARRKNSSFPSSHAANAMAFAWMLARRWPRGGPGFFLFAGLVGLSRLWLDRHYLSDVLAGFALAALVATAVLRAWPSLDPRRFAAGRRRGSATG
jgi:undecaprenyl-diphosphatase